MKQVAVEYFALFRERAGCAEEAVQTTATTAVELFKELEHRHGTDDPRGHCKVAINGAMADWDDNIADGDRVLLFPPVAGG
ncbi:MAG: MoaD/ThiS family protein [Pseudomonadota bacterium]